MLALATASEIERSVENPHISLTAPVLFLLEEHILHIWDALLKFLVTANLPATR